MAQSKIFIPTLSMSAFKAHYDAIYGQDVLSETQIREKVYGGKKLTELYSHVELLKAKKVSKQKLKQHKQWADIRLIATPESGRPDLVLKGVSIRQFLIAGLPYIQCGTSEGCPHSGEWDGENYWFDLHPQYRLELCHSEISRWSLFFKENGELAEGISDRQVTGDEDVTRMELVNNCTTSRGFEFRITVETDGGEDVYHGSFGDDGLLDTIYREFSQLQAGSLAEHKKNLTRDNQHPSFGFGLDDIYSNFGGWNGMDPMPSTDEGQGAPENTITIQLSRYMRSRSFTRATSACPELRLDFGAIKYDRWGGGEYYEKPKVRNLMIAIEPAVGESPKEPPITYQQVYDAKEIKLPDFPPHGIYNIAAPKPKRAYGRLAELSRCTATVLDSRWLWLELHRISGEGNFEFRRIVFGNLDVTKIPTYKASDPKNSFWTMHRFGYGARDTKQVYNEKFVLPHEENAPVHFGYLLAGTSRDPSHADYYICPESFGVERAIFTWESKNVLVVDLISFERILPVWQGRITFPSDFFKSQAA